MSLGTYLFFYQNFNIYVFQKLLDLIEDLRKKLIKERKEKLTLEFRIREEVTQEFTQYLAQREADFK